MIELEWNTRIKFHERNLSPQITQSKSTLIQI